MTTPEGPVKKAMGEADALDLAVRDAELDTLSLQPLGERLQAVDLATDGHHRGMRPLIGPWRSSSPAGSCRAGRGRREAGRALDGTAQFDTSSISASLSEKYFFFHR